MEEDGESSDYFSSFIIHQSSPTKFNNFDTTEEEQPRQKLKTKRKEAQIIPDDSRREFRCKLIVNYGGYFKSINKGTKRKYCFGRQRTIYFDKQTYDFAELFEEVSGLYPFDEDQKLLLFFEDKRVQDQSLMQLDHDESFELMLDMYEEKKLLIYVTKEKLTVLENETSKEDENILDGLEVEDGEFENYEEGSDYCHSEASYHGRYSDTENDDEVERNFEYEGEYYSYDKDNPKMKVGEKFPDSVAFRRALNHHAICNDFEYNLEKSELTRVTATCSDFECSWRIHASVAEDGVTFVVRTIQPKHACCGVNKRGNKHATQGWVADRVIGDLRKEADISPKRLQVSLETKFGISIPYNRVWEGKELALQEIYGKWDDSFEQINALKEEILRSNPGSVVEFKTESGEGENVHFQRFFVSFRACISGFLKGCRPYISVDACHLKGKWKGVLAAATAIDGNNWIFPVAFGVLESENEHSWEWFLRALYKAIEIPHGLVISADMQKGLQNALAKVYPSVEHRECMRHLFSNFKKHYHGDLFKFGLWGAARTYSPTRFKSLIDEMENASPAAIHYLNDEHNKLWSRSQFSTASKCDYITNNIAETFNSWINEERNKPVVDLIDSIRQKIMIAFDKRRRIANTWKGELVHKVADYIRHISRAVGGYDVLRSMNYCAEIQKDGLRWVVNLEEQTCTCRAWQVKGTPCVHVAAFIATIRNVRWENYVDSYFTVSRFKEAYALGIAPMLSRNEWIHYDLGYTMLPPKLKRHAGRPRKSRIKPSDEPKKRSHKCTRCGLNGHHKSTCKNEVQPQGNEDEHNDLMTQGLKTKRNGAKGNTRSKKKACPSNIFKILQEDKI